MPNLTELCILCPPTLDAETPVDAVDMMQLSRFVLFARTSTASMIRDLPIAPGPVTISEVELNLNRSKIDAHAIW